MAEWNGNPSWTPKDQINGGQQFAPDDILSPEDFNALVNNMQYLYSQGGDFEVNPYPIGAIYMSTRITSPASLFGGSWTRIQDKFLLAAGSSYSAGTTGGSATHTLTVNEMPSHNHNLAVRLNSTSGNMYTSPTAAGDSGIEGTSTWAVENNGGGQPHNNMPPYLAVYVWKRIA
jgi:hypothetical protein